MILKIFPCPPPPLPLFNLNNTIKVSCGETGCQRGAPRGEGKFRRLTLKLCPGLEHVSSLLFSRLEALLTAGQPGVLWETRQVIYLPSSQLVGLGDVGVDHQGAAEGRWQGTTSKVGQLCPLDGQDGLRGAIELLRLCGITNVRRLNKAFGTVLYLDIRL